MRRKKHTSFAKVSLKWRQTFGGTACTEMGRSWINSQGRGRGGPHVQNDGHRPARE